jgi:hypothetical protein
VYLGGRSGVDAQVAGGSERESGRKRRKRNEWSGRSSGRKRLVGGKGSSGGEGRRGEKAVGRERFVGRLFRWGRCSSVGLWHGVGGCVVRGEEEGVLLAESEMESGLAEMECLGNVKRRLPGWGRGVV